MYAAAGGASLASRQARQRQRQQNKSKQLQAKLHPKAVAIAAGEAPTPTRHHAAAQPSRQFHHLPSSYLRAPQAHGRKLSASYTAQSKLLLPIDEGDGQSVLHMHTHTHSHAHGGHGPPPTLLNGGGGRTCSPRLFHRYSASTTNFHHSHLQKSATATLPLVSQMEPTPPTTPLIAVGGSGVGGDGGVFIKPTPDDDDDDGRIQIQIPQDSIIITPATPIASPGHVAKQQGGTAVVDPAATAAERVPLTLTSFDDDDSSLPPPVGQLERKCSVYRMRRSGGGAAFDDEEQDVEVSAAATATAMAQQLQQLHQQQQLQQFEPLCTDETNLIFKGLRNGHKWTPCAYCEEGICVCEHIEIIALMWRVERVRESEIAHACAPPNPISHM